MVAVRQPNLRASEVDECDVVARRLFVARRDSAEALEVVEEDFDEIALRVERAEESGLSL
jgi:hypothetical protein